MSPTMTASTAEPVPPKEGVMTRKRGKLIVVSAATILGLYLCYLIAEPFLPALVWAAAGVVVTKPLHDWLRTRIASRTLAAAIATLIVALVLYLPLVAVTYLAAIETTGAAERWQDFDYAGAWKGALEDYPRIAAAWERVARDFDVAATAQRVAEQVQGISVSVLSGFAYILVQSLVALFALFYLYRDEEYVLSSIYRLSPLTESETRAMLNSVGDTTHATIFGTLVVAVVQGLLGGLIFWFLGLPTPMLWGLVMGLLAVIPYLGAFVIWSPAALYMFTQGEWGKATILILFGTLVIGLIDNLLYPMLVGTRLRQHTVIAFLALVGGIAVFGATGIVLGPVIVTLTTFLLEIWRRRTAAGQAADV